MLIHNEIIHVDSNIDQQKIDCLNAFPNSQYDVIYADPPWTYGSSGVGISNQCKKIYPTMSMQQLMDLPVKQLRGKNCALFLWTSSPQLPNAIKLMESWGFDFKTVFKAWRKTNNDGTPVCVPGWWSRSSVELLLVGSRGTPLKLWKTTNNEPQEYCSIREGHSKKPDDIRISIERFFNVQKRIELFSRTQNDNWDSWGLEVPGFFYNCDSLTNTIEHTNCRHIATQCHFDFKLNVPKKERKSKSHGGYSHHKSDCLCFVCKKIRLKSTKSELEKVEKVTKIHGGYSHHKPDCLCFVCKKIRKKLVDED